ncbi:MAG: hypothetical protein ACE5K4_11905 [Candidatus Hydrothermarchaeota archaeon]
MKSSLRFLGALMLTALLTIFLIVCEGGSNGGNGGGDSERLLNSFTQGSSGYYYNPPTLVGNYIYIGTSRQLNNDPANDNYFFKLDLNLNKIWEYSLERKEVRGGATLDSAGNIYFVVEEGRNKGDTSNSTLHLYSLDSNGNFR